MRYLDKCLFVSLILLTPTIAPAYTELPFCPSGGPPGWMNYFDYRQDKKNWRNHFRNQNYQRYYSVRPERYRSYQNSPGNGYSPRSRRMNQQLRQGHPFNQNHRFSNQHPIRR